MNHPYQPADNPYPHNPWAAPPPDNNPWPASDPMQQPPGYSPPPTSGPPGYGQPDPAYVPPASAPPGYPTPPHADTGGYGPPPPPPGVPPVPGMPGAPPPPKKSKAPLITMLVLGLVMVLGVGTVLFFTLGTGSTSTTAGGDDEKSTPAPSDSPSTKKEPSATPSDEPSDSPGDETFTGTLDETDFDDWDFALGDVSLSADKVDGWNYNDCTDIESEGALTDLGCKEAVEVAYEAEDGGMKLDVVFLIMEDETTASALKTDFDDAMFIPQNAGFIDDFEFGKFRIDNEANIGVLVLGTATGDVDTEKADEYLSYMFTDQRGALMFM